jgi:hypothetical protein
MCAFQKKVLNIVILLIGGSLMMQSGFPQPPFLSGLAFILIAAMNLLSGGSGDCNTKK